MTKCDNCGKSVWKNVSMNGNTVQATCDNCGVVKTADSGFMAESVGGMTIRPRKIK